MTTNERIQKLKQGDRITSRQTLEKSKQDYLDYYNTLDPTDPETAMKMADAQGYIDSFINRSSGFEEHRRSGRYELGRVYDNALAYLKGEHLPEIPGNRGATRADKLRIEYESANQNRFTSQTKSVNQTGSSLSNESPINRHIFDYTKGIDTDWDAGVTSSRGQKTKAYAEQLLSNLLEAQKAESDGYHMINWDPNYTRHIETLQANLTKGQDYWDSDKAYEVLRNIAKSFGGDASHWKSYFGDVINPRLGLDAGESPEALTNFENNFKGFTKEKPKGYVSSSFLNDYLTNKGYKIIFKDGKPYVVKSDYSSVAPSDYYIHDDQRVNPENIGHGFYIDESGRLYQGDMLNVTDNDFYDKIAEIVGSYDKEDSHLGRNRGHYSYSIGEDRALNVFNHTDGASYEDDLYTKNADKLHGHAVLDVSAYLPGVENAIAIFKDSEGNPVTSLDKIKRGRTGDLVFDDSMTVFYKDRNGNIKTASGSDLLQGIEGVMARFGHANKAKEIQYPNIQNVTYSADVEQARKDAEQRAAEGYIPTKVIAMADRTMYHRSGPETHSKYAVETELNSPNINKLKRVAETYLQALPTLDNTTIESIVTNYYINRYPYLTKVDAIVKAQDALKNGNIDISFAPAEEQIKATLNNRDIKPLLIKDINKYLSNVEGNTLSEKLKKIFPNMSNQELASIASSWETYSKQVTKKQEGGNLDKITNNWHAKFTKPVEQPVIEEPKKIRTSSVNYNKLRR